MKDTQLTSKSKWQSVRWATPSTPRWALKPRVSCWPMFSLPSYKVDILLGFSVFTQAEAHSYHFTFNPGKIFSFCLLICSRGNLGLKWLWVAGNSESRYSCSKEWRCDALQPVGPSWEKDFCKQNSLHGVRGDFFPAYPTFGFLSSLSL